ncbi:hypothetical protein PIB30_117955 [Stylosanthes scabra]|uniref:Uncharacterized protein n=1 Tax=Stylosanthes scabra TaxID=79078 RepID=A0ABU6Q749_9FABA|nr:hypothetical protein [Stylosanthes scabra]
MGCSSPESSWIMAVSVSRMVYSLVVHGGITRLTRSGLSMTDWKFTGTLPPMSHEEWHQEFQKPPSATMTGSLQACITLEMSICFVKLGVRLCGLFALGAGQGFIGWWMVKSGLEEPPSGYVQPRESPYCLAAHLTSAFSISLLVGLTAISGAFVDGNDAGHAFNTFLKMSNTWISDDIFEMTPLIRNFFENTSTVQFDHRILATASLVSVGILWLSTRKLEIHPAVRALIGGTLGMASLQVIISIFSFIPSLTFIICGSFLFSVYLLIAPCLEYSSFSPNILNQLRLITIDK